MTEKICEKCGNEAHHVHHLDENHKNDKSENLQLLCTLCHAQIHKIEPKKSKLKEVVIFRDRPIKIRTALENQIRGFGRIEYIVPQAWEDEKKNLTALIKGYEKEITKMLKSGEYVAWDCFLKDVKGISFITAGKLIAYIDIHNSPSISALWRYCGLDATHIRRTSKITKEEAQKFGNPYLKKELLGVLADSFVKQRTPIYRDIYDKEKARQIKRHLDGECERCTKLKLNKKPGHAHAMANRKAVKMFISHLWQEWRKAEGLQVSEPYAIAILNHSKKIEAKN